MDQIFFQSFIEVPGGHSIKFQAAFSIRYSQHAARPHNMEDKGLGSILRYCRKPAPCRGDYQVNTGINSGKEFL